jgi:RNA polymerase sigma factor (TIGR02999 family)
MSEHPQTTIGEVTQLLNLHAEGQSDAFDQLVGALYQHLCQAAQSQLNKVGPQATINANDLVHEVYLKLKKSAHFSAHNRGHFLALAATAMRQVVLDRLKAKGSQKRGGQLMATTLADHKAVIHDQVDEILMVNESLQALREVDSRLAETVECRYFAGYDEAQTAEALGVSTRTVRRYWVTAKNLLKQQFS